MLARTLTIAAAATGTALLAGCADMTNMFNSNSSNLTTSSVAPVAAGPKVDPVCISLASQIDGLRKEGTADKIEKASLKKYKMTTAELVKADQLNKANADFQNKCSNYKPQMAATPAAGTLSSATVASAATPSTTSATPAVASAAKQ